MPAAINWHDDAQRVLHLYITPPWNWADLHRELRTLGFRLHQLGHSASLLIDLSAAGTIPPGAVAHLRSLSRTTHPHLDDRRVIIGLPEGLQAALTGAAANDSVVIDGVTLICVTDMPTALARLALKGL